MMLTAIKASPTSPVYVNCTSQNLVKGAFLFYTPFRWNGIRLEKAVHDLYNTRSGWSANIDVTVAEICSGDWVTVPTGPIALDAGRF